ncbi:hypothetical protein ACDI16_21375, partial [Oceanobacillus caeni]
YEVRKISKGFKLIYVLLMIILFIGTVWLIKSHALNLSNQPPSSKQDRGDFLPKNSSFGSETNYDITLTMNSEGIFNVTSTSYIKNISDDKWNELVFYFIPNIFTEKNSPTLKQNATVKIDNIIVDGKTMNFSLDKDTLTVPLSEKLYPNKTVVVEISYMFTLPEEALRFTKTTI